MQLEGCTLRDDQHCGVHALQFAEVTVTHCSSTGNGKAGYSADQGARMSVNDSSSEGDKRGVAVGARGVDTSAGWDRGKLTMNEATIDGAVQSGTLP